MMNKLEIAVAALVETWRARCKLAGPSDAMLINKHMRELQETVAAIQAQPDAAVGGEAKDAARYRWLRDSTDSGRCIRGLYEDGQTIPSAVDAMIDAAIQAQGSDAA